MAKTPLAKVQEILSQDILFSQSVDTKKQVLKGIAKMGIKDIA